MERSDTGDQPIFKLNYGWACISITALHDLRRGYRWISIFLHSAVRSPSYFCESADQFHKCEGCWCCYRPIASFFGHTLASLHLRINLSPFTKDFRGEEQYKRLAHFKTQLRLSQRQNSYTLHISKFFTQGVIFCGIFAQAPGNFINAVETEVATKNNKKLCVPRFLRFSLSLVALNCAFLLTHIFSSRLGYPLE